MSDVSKQTLWSEREVFSNAGGKVIEEWQSAFCPYCKRYHTTPYMYYFDNYNYCPNCGHFMWEDKDGKHADTLSGKGEKF